jgi:DNA-binding transcriptional LysR family regulator
MEAFKCVVEEGNLTRASKKMALTQPAITHRITSLEHELRQNLFDRAGSTVRLTHAGEVFYEYVQRILNLAQESRLVLQEIADGTQGRISIAAIGTSAIYMLPDFLYTFRQGYPGIHVILRTLSGEEIRDMVLTGQIDLGIVGSHIDTAALEATELFEDHIRPLVHPGHRCAASRRAALSDLAREPFIQFGGWKNWKNYITSLFDRIEAIPREQFQVDSIDAVKRLVELGLGFTIAPVIAAEDEIRQGTLVPLELTDIPPVSRQILLIHARDKFISQSMRLFIDAIKAEFEKRRLSPSV